MHTQTERGRVCLECRTERAALEADRANVRRLAPHIRAIDVQRSNSARQRHDWTAHVMRSAEYACFLCGREDEDNGAIRFRRHLRECFGDIEQQCNTTRVVI